MFTQFNLFRSSVGVSSTLAEITFQSNVGLNLTIPVSLVTRNKLKIDPGVFREF
jgi:hypothetical protein